MMSFLMLILCCFNIGLTADVEEKNTSLEDVMSAVKIISNQMENLNQKLHRVEQLIQSGSKDEGISRSKRKRRATENLSSEMGSLILSALDGVTDNYLQHQQDLISLHNLTKSGFDKMLRQIFEVSKSRNQQESGLQNIMDKIQELLLRKPSEDAPNEKTSSRLYELFEFCPDDMSPIDGSVELPVIPAPGHFVKIVGKFDECNLSRLNFNFGSTPTGLDSRDQYIHLHFDMRFAFLNFNNVISMNIKADGTNKWNNSKEVFVTNFPYKAGDNFEFVFKFEENKYTITNYGEFVGEFEYLFPLSNKITHFFWLGDGKVDCIEVNQGTKCQPVNCCFFEKNISAWKRNN